MLFLKEISHLACTSKWRRPKIVSFSINEYYNLGSKNCVERSVDFNHTKRIQQHHNKMSHNNPYKIIIRNQIHSIQNPFKNQNKTHHISYHFVTNFQTNVQYRNKRNPTSYNQKSKLL